MPLKQTNARGNTMKTNVAAVTALGSNGATTSSTINNKNKLSIALRNGFLYG